MRNTDTLASGRALAGNLPLTDENDEDDWMMLILRLKRREIGIELRSELASFSRDAGSGLEKGFR
jgi:hypothetical protein